MNLIPRRFHPALVSLVAIFACGSLSAQTLARISESAGGLQGSAASSRPSMTPDGRYMAFYSDSPNLVPGDTNLVRDIFVFDRQALGIERVSVSSAGIQGNGKSSRPRITPDGRYVAFYSDSTNLVAGDTNLQRDVFVHDRQTGVTVRVSVGTSGVQGNGLSTRPTISADGRFVAFASDATDLSGLDTNLARDVFLRDRDTDMDGIYDEVGAVSTTLISVGAGSVQGNGTSSIPRMSADGRFIAYRSIASNLVVGDTNLSRDVFVRDTLLGTTTRVSLSTSGLQGDGDSSRPTVSADGRYIAFNSVATNLVVGDTNQHCAFDPFGQLICGPATDCFIRDRDADGNGVFDEVGGVSTVRVSISTADIEGNDRSEDPEISADGRYVAFWTEATNLFPGDTNGFIDVVLRDRDTDGNGIMDEVGGVSTTVISTSTAGVLGNADSKRAVVSDGGRFVAYRSLASNLVSADTNLVEDVFVHGDCPATHFGMSTPACAGPEVIDLPFCVVTGDAATFTCTNVPPSTSGFLVVGLRSLPSGLSVAGITLFFDLSKNYFTFAVTSDASGYGKGKLPPAPPSVAGVPFTSQFIWFNTAACPGTGAFSASDAISTALQ